jgi:hypothetical protein
VVQVDHHQEGRAAQEDQAAVAAVVAAAPISLK